MRILLIFISLVLLPANAALQEQELQPVISSDKGISQISAGKTFANYKGSRVFASKKKTYPFLDQMEELLYPGKNFQSENPGKRLERVEIAVFGAKQSGSIPDRISKLELEVENWQIANAQALSILNSKIQPTDKEQAFTRPQEPKITQPRQIANNPYYPPPQYQYSVKAVPKTRVVDYDYQNYRMASPLIQNIGRKTIDLLFKGAL